MTDFFRSALAFLVVLGVLVFIHELGHYLAARWRGIHVEAFSIGFGRSFASWTDRHGTVWKLAWLPLGGYVKLHGQERPEDVPDEVRDAWIPGRTFHEKSVLSRAIVVAAGPIANFLLAGVLFSALFMTVGRSGPSGTVIGEVLKDGPAARAGLLAQDRIESIDGAPVEHFDDIVRIVTAAPNRPLALRLERAGQQIEVTPTTDGVGEDGHKIGQLGIRNVPGEPVRLDPVSAIGAGAVQTWEAGRQTLGGLVQMLTGQRGTEDLGGPLRIAQLSGQVAQLGFASLVSFIAILSVNLGLINLFPIPVLDGGHLMFFAAEAVRGRPLPRRAQEYGYRAGFALIASLMLFATWNDLSHTGVFRWFAGLIG